MSSEREIKATIATHSMFLESIMKRPGINHLAPAPPEDPSKYQLRFVREKQIADGFAFLAARNYDPMMIMAVAVEEHEDKNGLTLRVASNTGNLEGVQEGLTGLGLILGMIASRVASLDSCKRTLLERVVEFDRPRILSRLRSRHAEENKESHGQKILNMLSNELQYRMPRKPCTPSLLKKIQKARLSSAILKEDFIIFEKMEQVSAHGAEGRETLITILQKILNLTQEIELDPVLAQMDKIDPSIATSLAFELGQLGRYVSLCNDFATMAGDRKYSVFKNIDVAVLQEPIVDQNLRTSLKNTSFDQVLGQFRLPPRHNVNISRSRAEFNRLRRSLTTYKIHAEIQLLFFYERRSGGPIPRILSSNKGACYLCQLFITMHGKYTVPGTHSTIYNRWTTPPLDNGENHMLQTLQKVSSALKRDVQTVLRRKQFKYTLPNHSAIADRTAVSPYTLSAVTSVVSMEHSDPKKPVSLARMALESRAANMRPALTLSRLTISEPRPHSTFIGNGGEDATSLRHTVDKLLDNKSCIQIEPNSKLSVCLQAPEFILHCEKTRIELSAYMVSPSDLRPDQQPYWVSIHRYDDLNGTQKDNSRAPCIDLHESTIEGQDLEQGGAQCDTSLNLRFNESLIVVKFEGDETSA